MNREEWKNLHRQEYSSYNVKKGPSLEQQLVGPLASPV